MARRDLIVVGGSAGAHTALRKMLARLPADLPAAVVVVTHLAPGARSVLADMLARDSTLPVAPATDGAPLRLGHVHVAVPNRHLVIGAGDVLRLTAGPRDNGARPAVDPLFHAAARWAGPRVIGVVLSGSLDDGAAGLATVTARGGAALVQDPGDARFPGMPRAALAAVPSAVVAPTAELAKVITEWVGRPVPDAGPAGEALIWETDMIADGRSDARYPGRPVALGCPECGGGMYESRTGDAVHYVCHAGHAWSPQAFVAARDDGVEEALWTAISAMQEKITMLGEMAAQAERTGNEPGARAYRAEAGRVGRAVEVVREHALGAPVPPD